jgi:ribonuclease HI
MINVFTDGSANWKSGLGGSGVYILLGDEEVYLQQGWRNTKTGRSEIRALIIALEYLLPYNKEKITIYSDSMYVINGVRSLPRWRMEKFFNKKNVDLWVKVDLLLKYFSEVRFKHVKGHQEDKQRWEVFGNSVADILANYRQFDHYKEDLKQIF